MELLDQGYGKARDVKVRNVVIITANVSNLLSVILSTGNDINAKKEDNECQCLAP